MQNGIEMQYGIEMQNGIEKNQGPQLGCRLRRKPSPSAVGTTQQVEKWIVAVQSIAAERR